MDQEEEVPQEWFPEGPYCHHCFWEKDKLGTLCLRRLHQRDVPLVSEEGVIFGDICNLCASLCYNCERLETLFYCRKTPAWLCFMCREYKDRPYLFKPRPGD